MSDPVCYDGYAAVPNLGKTYVNHSYLSTHANLLRCLALNEDFSNGIDPATWHREVRLDGYGNGAFTWTTADDTNAFVQDKTLYIVPTLTSDIITPEQITNGYTLNLTADGTCTSNNVTQCVASSNSSHLSIINPIRTARLTTVNSVNLKYGKVEVKAKFPTGDWLWPRISLLPVNDTYGPWPLSGQIDVLTARGNNASYPQRGVDYAQSDLHWGKSVHTQFPTRNTK
jgi:beta-glucanase (GH16 family)